MNKKSRFDSKIWKNMIFFLLMIVFFVCVILVYYHMVAGVTKRHILDTCEFNATSSAERIDKYLSAGVNCMDITGYTIDNMLLENRSSEEILEYLESQSVVVENIISEVAAGVYGYINDEYLDGSGWVPDADYVPTERPWYIQAKANKGKIVLLDPYVDAMTGDVIITIAKSLCDEKSVVAIDLSMRELQTIVESLPEENEEVMVMTRDFIVVCHSNSAEIGKDYGSKEDTFGNSMVEAYKASGMDTFPVEYSGTKYMVYAITLDNTWICMSVIDTTDQYRSLYAPLLLTILVMVVFMTCMLTIMIASNKRQIKAAELEREKMNAVASDQAKSQFLANMSHEIRTPINAVLGMNEMILREAEQPEIREYAADIQRAGNVLLGLVNDILDFSKIESGKVELINAEYDLGSLLYDLVTMAESRVDEKNLLFVEVFDQNLPRFLCGDEMRIRQIITNILANAIKYTEKGTVTFRMHFEKDAQEADSVLLHIEVIDTGIGIKEEDMPRLFAEFERIEESRNRYVEGTGLGMSITLNLLKMMGSALQVESTYGEGSRFFFTLKQTVTDWTPLGDFRECFRSKKAEALKKNGESFTAENARVLVVDDNSMNLAVFKSLVKRSRIQVDTAESGDEGLLLAGQREYDMIFLDHMMPGKDGIETLFELRSTGGPNCEKAAVCLTANAISGAREKYMEAGFEDYLSKPIDAKKLEELLIKYLPEDKVQRVEAETEQTKDEGDTRIEYLRKIPGIDAEAGIKNSGGEDAYFTMVRIFFDSVDAKSEELSRFYEAGNLEDYTIKVHALKSSARIIGADKIGEMAQGLEDAGKRNDIDYIREHHLLLMDAYLHLKEQLAPLFAKEENTENNPQADAETMRKAYREMKEAAEAMDCDGLEAVFKEMEKYAIPAEEQELWKQLQAASEQFDYDNVFELLDGL